MEAIGRAAVIGTGVMGSAIAAHIANAGVPVVLMDIVPEGAASRNHLAEAAIARLLESRPAAFMHPRNGKLITPANIEDDMPALMQCDWIVEAVVENPAVKRSLYERIKAVRKVGSLVSSNTSTIPLETLVAGLPESFVRDFVITHFFNPPRYMRLLELIADERVQPNQIARFCEFADLRLGKTVVRCKDTPGFIANRIGAFWVECAIGAAMDAGLDIETADAAIGLAFGVPKTGVFGLLDLVGLDLAAQVTESLRAQLPADDEFHRVRRGSAVLERMVADGYIGRKAKGGFYRLRQGADGRVKEVMDFGTGEYRPARKQHLPDFNAGGRGLRALIERGDPVGRYAWHVLSETLLYATLVAPRIAHDLVAIDEAMRLGYNWGAGPFELIDNLGAPWFAQRMKAEGRAVPDLLADSGRSFYRTEGTRLLVRALDGGYAEVRRAPGVLSLADVKRGREPLARNASASLWNLGDGVACLEFHSKMNALDAQSLALLRQSIDIVVGHGLKGLVIGNDADHFSVGANIAQGLYLANIALWPVLEDVVKDGQAALVALKYAPFPVVAAPSGLALGGACEILLHCDAIQAHAESYIGLVEVGVGVVPAWGGCKELLARWISHDRRPQGPMPAISQAFETIGLAKVSTSAAEAKDLLFLRRTDDITRNRDRVLADAKAKVLALSESYRPPERAEMALPGETAKVALLLVIDGLVKSGKATSHDGVIAEHLASVLSGGDADITEVVAEEHLLRLEREAFMTLIRSPATLARMEHMLTTGKPLRN
jgi:3-hydroxyacyl-CoA dehydrogenase